MSKKNAQPVADIDLPLDRGFYNASYMMLLLNSHLAQWAKEHKLNTPTNHLMFVTQIESTDMTDVYLSMVYFDGEKEHVIPAGYVGQKLTSKEEQFCKTLPYYTTHDLIRKPPYEIMMSSRLKDLKDKSGIVSTTAMALHSFMVETASVSEGIPAQLASGNGNAYLFIRDNEGTVTKMEFYLKDMSSFINKIDERRYEEIRQSIKGILKQDKSA